MSVGIKLKLIRLFSNFIFKLSRKFVPSYIFAHPFFYKIGDFVLKISAPKDGIYEIQGFKIKLGRTTRFLPLVGEFSESSTIELIRKEVQKGMHVFDLGANIGWFTLVFSKLVGHTGHVYSFEPDPYTFGILKENIKLNNLKNVSIFQLATSNKVGTANLYLDYLQDGSNKLKTKTQNENSVEIKTTTLDEFCKEHKTKVDLIKMDIEGSEPKTFEGMKNVILKNPNIKIVSEFFPGAIKETGSSPQGYLNLLERSEFIINQIDEKNLGKFKPFSKEELLKVKICNLYCFKS